jgi:uncharacterized membrane protein (DUF2068 family)
MLLSLASGVRRSRPAPEVLQAVEGYNLFRTSYSTNPLLTIMGAIYLHFGIIRAHIVI